jgi:hypothetical protein
MLRRHLQDTNTHPVRVGDPHLQQPPRLPPGLPQDRHATLAELPSHPGLLAHLQPQRHARGWRRGRAARQLQEPATQEEDRAPFCPAAELAVDRQSERVAVEHPAALGVGWAQQHAAAQHVHGAMIAQQTPPGGVMPAPGRWSKRTRNVMQGSVLIPSYGRFSRFGHEADQLIAPPTDPNVTKASVSAGHRGGGAPAGIEPATPSLPWNHREPLCGPPFPRSRATVRAKVMRSLFVQ